MDLHHYFLRLPTCNLCVRLILNSAAKSMHTPKDTQKFEMQHFLGHL